MVRTWVAWTCAAALVAWSGAARAIARGDCEIVPLPTYGVAGTSITTSLTVWDPDGDGPAPEMLVAWRTPFFVAGVTPVHTGLAVWDGERWESLSRAGIQGQLTCVVGNGSRLYVATSSPDPIPSDFSGVYLREGGAFTQLGTNLRRVVSLAVGPSGVFAAGSFTSASGARVSRVVRWTGDTWEILGDELQGTPILRLAEDGSLLAAGNIALNGEASGNRVARWDGARWVALGGVTNAIDRGFSSLESFNGDVYVCGNFNSIGGDSAQYFARWDGGHWVQLSSGSELAEIGLLAKVGDELVVAGSFSQLGGAPITAFARWNGDSFAPLASTEVGGIWNPVGGSVVAFRDGLAVSGYFNRAGSVVTRCVALLDSDGWHSTGGTLTGSVGYSTGIAVSAATEFQGELVLGGTFSAVGDCDNIARRTADGWAGFGAGTPIGGITTFIEFNGELIAAGNFTHSPGILHGQAILRWNGSEWLPLGSGFESVGGSEVVQSMCVFQGDLVIGGRFPYYGSIRFPNVARWDGATWSAMGSGLRESVTQLQEYHGVLYAIGDFPTPPRGIARWNGAEWTSVGTPPFGRAYCMTVFQDKLFVAGTGTTTAGAIWNGAEWTIIPGGPANGRRTEEMLPFAGKLILAGTENPTSLGAPNIAARVWDPETTQWSVLPTDSSQIRLLAATDNELVALADPDSVSKASDRVLRWTCAPPRTCPGDLNGDFDVNLTDLALLLGNYGLAAPPGESLVGDIDGDGRVSIADLAVLLRDFPARCQ